MKARTVALLGLGIALIALIAWIVLAPLLERSETPEAGSNGVIQDDSGRQVLYWYDPMVPAQRFERPGKSPFMDMQLVPKYADEASESAVRISPAVQQNLGIRLAEVQRTRFGESVAAVARIEADERRLHELSSRVPGYVERLLVRAEGDPVSAGQKVAEIYSPELLSAQQELLALARAQDLREAGPLVDAAKKRLRLLGMAEQEIDAVMQRDAALTRFGLYAPAAGFVTDIAVREGAQIERGATLMSIANLASVWLIAEVPEREASQIGRGDPVMAHPESAPGESFSGTVDYIYPTLDAATRTARVRIVAANEHNRLRPGMLARVLVSTSQREVLSVPSEAVIHTGTRTVVIVKGEGGFRPAEVRVGTEHEGRSEILAGLEAGDEVVASGQFLIDSEASLSGVLARLSQAEIAPEHVHEPERREMQQ